MPNADLARIGQSLALRDIHLPPVPGWWPPAPGWWLLAGVSATLTLLLLLLWQRGRRLRYRRQALRQLACLAQTNGISSHDLLAELSILLKRAALYAFPDEQCAGLSGEAWLHFLDRSLPDKLFTTGVGRCLASGPYQQAVEIDHEALLSLCQRWLRRLPPAPSRGRAG